MLQSVITALRKNNTVKESIPKEDVEGYLPLEIDNGFTSSRDGMIYKMYRIHEQSYEQFGESDFKHLVLDFKDGLLGVSSVTDGVIVDKMTIKENVYKHEKEYNFEFQPEKYIDFQKKKYLFSGPILNYKTYLFIGVSANKKISKKINSPLNTPFATHIFSDDFEYAEKVFKSFDEISKRFLSKLQASKIKFVELNDDASKDLLYQYLNLDFTTKGKKGVQNNYLNKYPYFQVGDKLVGISSFDGEIQEISSSLYNEYGVTCSFNYNLFHKLNFPHMVRQFALIGNQDFINEQIEEKKNFFRNGGQGVIAEDVEVHMESVVASGEKLVHLGTSVIYWGKSEAELDFYSDEVGIAIGSLGKCGVRKETIEDVGNLFFTLMPGAAHNCYRSYPYPTLYAAMMMSFSGQYYSKGEFLVKGRDGRPFFIQLEPEDSKKANNITIVGPTGGGKSFLTNVMTAHYRERGDEVYIIDKNDSYSGLCEIMGGVYFDFDDLLKVDLNFFVINKGLDGKYNLTDDDKIKIGSVLNIIWGDDNQTDQEANEQKSVMDVLLEMYYANLDETKAFPKMDSFFRFITEVTKEQVTVALGVEVDFKDYFNKEGFLLALRAYISSSKSGTRMLFNHESNGLNIDNKFCVFDLKNIANNPQLFSIITVSLMNLLMKKVYGRKDVRKHVLMDESSEVLETDLGKLFRVFFREIRKENGDVTVIVQLLSDLSSSRNGKVILNNATHTFLLDHKLAQEELPSVRTTLNLTDHKFDQLCSLNKVPSEKRREVFHLKEDESLVFAIEVPESLKLAFSSDSVDHLLFKEYLEKYKSPQLALRQYVTNLNLN